MGAPKLKWTSEEEVALRTGVGRYGTGKWRTILKDPDFAVCLAARSNVDLKDKWRNLMSSMSPGGQGSKTPRAKPIAPVPLSSVAPNSPTATSSAAVAISDNVISSRNPILTSSTARNHSPRCDYDDMILEALTALQDPNGVDVATIASFMEDRHQLPPSFRRALSSKLKRLVSQEKILRVRNSYKLRDMVDVNSAVSGPPVLVDGSMDSAVSGPPVLIDGSMNSAVSGPPVLIDGSMQLCSNGMDASSVDTVNQASMAAAMKMAEAEAMSALAEEAAREAEIDAKLADEADALLEAANSVFDFDFDLLDEVDGFSL